MYLGFDLDTSSVKAAIISVQRIHTPAPRLGRQSLCENLVNRF